MWRFWRWPRHPTHSDGFETVGTVTMPRMFPNTIMVGSVTITLYADGTWSGDREAFLRELAVISMFDDPSIMVELWLVANAIQNTRSHDQDNSPDKDL